MAGARQVSAIRAWARLGCHLLRSAQVATQPKLPPKLALQTVPLATCQHIAVQLRNLVLRGERGVLPSLLPRPGAFASRSECNPPNLPNARPPRCLLPDTGPIIHVHRDSSCPSSVSRLSGNAHQMAEATKRCHGLPRVEAMTAPFQHALTTKAGCESVAHILQSLTDQNERATIVSIDGVGACDLMSRDTILEGTTSVPESDRLLPFVRYFHGSPSTCLLEDQAGVTHMIPQGEGGEQGDPLMPLLFNLGMHPTSVAAQERLDLQKESSFSWSTCALSASLKGCNQWSAFWQRSCGHTLTSKCTTGKPKCGIESSP